MSLHPGVLPILALALVASAGATPVTLAAGHHGRQPVEHLAWNAYAAVLDGSEGSISEASFKNPPNPICTIASTDPNVSTDCEDTGPHSETAIAVNPTNPDNLVGAACDYQLKLSPGGQLNLTAYSRARVSFDAGRSWATVPLDTSGYIITCDPGVAFDAAGMAYISTDAFKFGQRGPALTTPDMVVSHSPDGGAHWSEAVRVAKGTGTFGSPGNFNDKDALTAWGDGNAILTWTLFKDGVGASYRGSPIVASVTHDGGNTWTAPVEISGSAPFCAGLNGDAACDQDQGSVPVVAADGYVHVSFMNFSADESGRSQYLVVKLDPSTGQRVSGPFKVAGVYDGFTDYPINQDGVPTYQDSQFRTWGFGNIAADPTSAGHLAVAWSDMRNSVLPAPSDPYQATTNSDIIVSQSFDGGQNWSAPVAISAVRDQFMPWASYGPDGKLRLGYFDRSYDPANHAYGFTIATETAAGTLSFATTQLTTALSDPTKDNRWGSSRTPNPAFPHPTGSIGDYPGIDASQGFTAALWTDERIDVCFTVRCGHGQDAFFGALPLP